MQALRRPAPKARSDLGLHAVADGNDHIKIVVIYVAPHLPIAFLAN